MTITEFLTARLDEREQQARAAERGGDGVWSVGDLVQGDDCRIEGDEITIYDEGGHTAEQAAFIASNDPKFVLADVASKRLIIRVHSPFGLEPDGTPDPYATDRDRLYCQGCGFDGVEEYNWLLEECPTLRALAQPFAAHEDFDPAWRVPA